MGKKKDSNHAYKKDIFLWTPQMDDQLIDALYTQHVQGNRIDGNFTPKAYENIVLELREKIGMDINKDKVKNRMKSLKANFSECYDLFNKGGLSGFAWNPVTKFWSAEPEVWERLIEQANPNAKKWRHTPIGNYEKLVDLFAKDRATGASAETAKEKRKRWASSTCEDYESIDQLLSQNEVTLENFDCIDDYGDKMTSPGTTSQVPSQSVRLKRQKRKTSNGDDRDAEMIKAIQSVAEPIKEGNSMFEKSQPQVYSEQEPWNDLQAIGFPPPLLTYSYLYLIENPDKRREFFGCPFESRKDLLERMMCGHGSR